MDLHSELQPDWQDDDGADLSVPVSDIQLINALINSAIEEEGFILDRGRIVACR
jgi:hypothetical protein